MPISAPANASLTVKHTIGPRHTRIRLSLKLMSVVVIALTWAGLSLWLAIPWIAQLGSSITLFGAIVVIFGIAILPGYLNATLIASLFFDKAPALNFDLEFPALTVVIACFNEQATITETLDGIIAQDYSGDLHILVADDGSTDDTVEIVREYAKGDSRISVIDLAHGGKANCLSAALKHVKTPLTATVDADTILTPSALRRIVSRLLVSPADTVAVAGAVFVRNSAKNWITRVQEWDYLLGIASVKRQQSLFQGTLVAQGAFSIYKTAALLEVGGWPDRIGEDIVLTWGMIRKGGRVGYERTAIAFTSAPETLKGLARQRRRWARGMIEGLREHGPALLVTKKPSSHAVLVNFSFPYIDTVFLLAFPIGLTLALFGNFAIIGPMTLIVLPLNMILSAIMFGFSRQSFSEVGLKLRRNRLGYLGYLLGYQFFMAPTSVIGYAQELLGTARRW